jgi:hypothetical protein
MSEVSMGFSASRAGGLLVIGVALAGPALADEWDLGQDTDDAATTDNVLAHGADQRHDLSVRPGPSADQDWYLVTEDPLSSYEFVVDGMTGDLDLSASAVQRLGADATTVESDASTRGSGGVQSLAWSGDPLSGPVTKWVRVQGAACGTSCGDSDRYRARFYDTTYTVPRFNNSGTQQTVLVIQNASETACSITLHFLSESGLLANSAARILPAHASLVLPTASLATDVPTGSIRVVHGCGYGGLAGKAVALEPATGFTFDTAMLPRPY